MALSLALLVGATVASAAGIAVEGTDRARLLAPAGATIESYHNAGYRLEMVEGEVRVRVELEPIESKTPFEAPRGDASSPIERLARAVTAGAPTQYDAASRLLGWVARNLDYELDRTQPQDALSVLERRSGYCTGIARVTVSLLEAVGIEAREVAGWVADDGPGGMVTGDGYHRWIEIRYPDRGWMFSDPMATHHYVPATYVRLAGETLFPSQGTSGLLLERDDLRSTVDLYPMAVSGVSGRRNHDRQLAAALRVRVEGRPRGTAVLDGGQRRRVHALYEGGTTFVGLDPGRYTLRLLLPGATTLEREIELDDRVRSALFLPRPTMGDAGSESSTTEEGLR